MQIFDVNVGFLLAQIINLALIIGLIVGIVVFLPRLLRRKDGTPLDILKSRLARGEINTQEFERLRALIRDEEAAKPKRAADDDSTVDSAEYEQLETAVRRRRLNDDDR